MQNNAYTIRRNITQLLKRKILFKKIKFSVELNQKLQAILIKVTRISQFRKIQGKQGKNHTNTKE